MVVRPVGQKSETATTLRPLDDCELTTGALEFIRLVRQNEHLHEDTKFEAERFARGVTQEIEDVAGTKTQMDQLRKIAAGCGFEIP